MKIKTKLALLLLSLVLLSGCVSLNTPPDVKTVETLFQSYCKEIDTITTYMLISGYEDIFITDASGTMVADLERIPIEDGQFLSAVTKIINSGTFLQISKRGNTISLLQWRGVRDIGCGIAYTIDVSKVPDVEFLTKVVPISDDGWYYYISDYNSWREGKRATSPQMYGIHITQSIIGQQR